MNIWITEGVACSDEPERIITQLRSVLSVLSTILAPLS